MAFLVFQFPTNVSAADAIHAVANHFAVGVSIMGQPANVPAHIKQAVEAIGVDNPANGTEQNPAIAFGGLLNGGNAGAASSADAATSTTVHAAQTGTSQTSAPVSSIPALPGADGVIAQTQQISAAPTNPASVEFDAKGLAWDERIHSGAKSKTPGGEWRSRKGVDKSLIKTVELELRAKYPNGAASGAVATSVPGATVSNTNAVVSTDPNAKKLAALAFAKSEALRVAGPQVIDDPMLDGIMSGSVKQFTVSPQQNEWLSVYYAKYQAAYAEFMARPNDAPATPAAPLAPVSSQVAAGTAAPVTGATPGAELDASGLPWDARINVPARLKDAAGVWLQRFDVAGESKLMVMAELRQALAGNVAAAQSTAPVGDGATPVAPTLPVAPVLITAAEASTDFKKLMQWVVANQVAGRISATAGPDAARDVGFVGGDGHGQLVLIREQPAAWPYVVQLLQAQGAM